MTTKKKRSSAKSPAKNKTGRPSKLTADIQNKIIEAIRAGAYVETAAAYAGINKSTFYDWLKKGARGLDPAFVEFSNAIERALASSEMRDIVTITKAADVHWQAAAWRLERKHPNRWGRRQHVELSGADGGPVSLMVSSWSDLIKKANASTKIIDAEDGGGSLED